MDMTMDADGSIAMGYTTEQQARLHVDVFGSSAGSTAQQQSNTHYGNPVHSALAKVRMESLPVTLFVRSLLDAGCRPSSWLAGWLAGWLFAESGSICLLVQDPDDLVQKH
jgi:hypothetical protein